jgi:hypothetical protein
VSDPLGITPIFQASGQTLGYCQPPIDLGQDQNASIRCQLTAVEGDVDRLAADRWKPR